MRKDQIFFGICTVAAVGSVLACVRLLKAQRVQPQEQAYHVPTTLRATEVIGSKPNLRGNTEAPLTLVEFGDYECPPCKQTYRELEKIMAKSPSSGRLVFRHFPLMQLHPYAFEAAVAAEAAGEQGKFWQMHDLLYNTPLLSSARIGDCVKQLGLDRTRFDQAVKTTAKARVQNDLKLSNRLQFPGTPMLLLCEANGTVHATNLDEVSTKLTR